jgi:hypothetical protein
MEEVGHAAQLEESAFVEIAHIAGSVKSLALPTHLGALVSHPTSVVPFEHPWSGYEDFAHDGHGVRIAFRASANGRERFDHHVTSSERGSCRCPTQWADPLGISSVGDGQALRHPIRGPDLASGHIGDAGDETTRDGCSSQKRERNGSVASRSGPYEVPC